MWTKAVISLLLGTSSVAVAQDYDVYRHRDDYHSRYQRPILLAQDVMLVARRNRPTFIPVPARSHIDRLRFDVDWGLAYIEAVVVQFADGRRQTMLVRHLLSAGDPAFSVQLPHGPVSGVYIHGNSRLRADRFTYGTGRADVGLVDVVGLSSGYGRRW